MVTQLSGKRQETSTSSTDNWYIKSNSRRAINTQLNRLPFRIGRLSSSDLSLPFAEVSRLHAEILEYDGELHIRECGSTNGTFINRQRLYCELPLYSGDIIHIGPVECQIYYTNGAADNATQTDLAHATCNQALNTQIVFADYSEPFAAMMQNHIQSIKSLFQPLISLRSKRPKISGYELLSRCVFKGLPHLPQPLLQIAALLKRQTEFSELLRQIGLAQAQLLGNTQPLFVNAAAAETQPLRLAHSLSALRRNASEIPLVLELNETTTMNTVTLRNIRAVLDDLEIELAFDGFGVGQSRFLDILNHPPDWLKFDSRLINQLHNHPKPTQQLLRAMLTMANDSNIKTIAKGVETESIYKTCRRLGFGFAQGYYFGKPQPFFSAVH